MVPLVRDSCPSILLFCLFQRKAIHPFVVAKLKDNATSSDVAQLLAYYRALGGRLTPGYERSDDVRENSCSRLKVLDQHSQTDSMGTCEMDYTDPRNHQRISVLFCSFSHYSNNAPEFCMNPW